ncbi:MAG: hypothetical protein CSA18_03450 [Deltaproteobacteria bacterium]|nr:MAG: hypothetical protein CSA18_03450 [Deltaproteobacteria bacterium]
MDKKIIFLVIAALVLGGGLFFKTKKNEIKDLKETPDYETLAKTVQIEIISSNDKIILLRNKDKWTVKNRFDFQADFSEINELIKELKNMNFLHSFKADKESLEKLSLLNPEKNKNKSGTLICLKDKNGKTLFSIIAGKKREKGGQYIKIPGKDEIFISASQIYLDLSPAFWIKKQALDIKKDDISEITLLSEKNKKIYQIKKDNKIKYKIIYPDKKDLSPDKNKIDSLFSSLSGLEIKDIISPVEKNQFSYKFIFKTQHKDIITIFIENKDKGRIYFNIKNNDKNKKTFISAMMENFILEIPVWKFEKFIIDPEKLYIQKKNNFCKNYESR